MKKLILIIISTVLLLLGLFFSNSCKPDRSIFETKDLDEAIMAEINDQHIPSISAGIIKDNELVWKGVFGYSDVEEEISSASSTPYILMSLSKLMIVTAAMQLKEQGLLDLDEDINRYIDFTVRNPKFPDVKITPRMLVTHTSSLTWPETDTEIPGFYEYYYDDQSMPPLGQWLREYIVPGGAGYVDRVWKDYAPGSREQYSNIGAALLAYLVETISGEDYRDYCQTKIFEPLEMINTSYYIGDLQRELIAIPYRGGNQPLQHYTYKGYPGGFLRSSLDDFSHFLITYLNGGRYRGKQILRPETIEEILTMSNPASGICLIWYRSIGNWYGHSGGGDGGSSRTDLHRGDKLAILIICNQRHETVYPGGKIYNLIRDYANNNFR